MDPQSSIVVAKIPVGTVGQSVNESIFVLAVEIGSSHIVVATARLTQSEQTEVALHEWAPSQWKAPATAYLSHDDTLLFGDEAADRAVEDPARAVTDFTYRLGDDIPLVIDGCALPAELLYAEAARWAIETVTGVEGVDPAALVLTHPAYWGEHRLATLREALNRQGITDISLIPAAKAAAMHRDASHPLEPGDAVAVYDLGAETAGSVVLRKRHDGLFDIIGEAVHIDEIGGSGFDDAVLEHVIAAVALGDARVVPELNISRLRDAVRAAKEALSFRPDATITVPAAAASVRITRPEFEDMIVDDVDQSLEALTQAIESALVAPSALTSVLLAGGSSRIPFIAQRLSDRFECPIVVDAVPEASAVLGAARAELSGLRTGQLSENETDGQPDDAQSFSPALAGASRAPASALRRGLTIFFTIAAAVMAGAIVLGAAAAVGDTRSAPSSGDTTPPSGQSIYPAADSGNTPNPNPEPARGADPPPPRDPTRTEPIPRNPAQEHSSGVNMG